jgi:2-dehydro-3-deoxyphosphooctonate aldolase (KDO 8-P synthase)
MKQNSVSVGRYQLSNEKPLAIIAGPCILETEALTLSVAKTLAQISRRLNIPIIFKCSYDKANRSSVKSFRGIGLSESLAIFARVKKETGLPMLTDVHDLRDVPQVSRTADVLQIPAFLCRQTDLIVEAARSGAVVNVKKGQFLSPLETRQIINKAESVGCKKIMLTERGTTFGYNNLVVDMRGLAIMKTLGYPVVFDATHSVQLPGAQGTSSGGQREFVETLARAAVAVGVAAVFMEVHPNPAKALSDGPNAVRLSDVPAFLMRLKAIDALAKKWKKDVVRS